MKRLCLVVAVLWLMVLSPAVAVEPDEFLSDAALEARARALSKELRCMVCQNQSIDDSDAGKAHAGGSGAAIGDFAPGRAMRRRRLKSKQLRFNNFLKLSDLTKL